jgi:hypothetical protein
VRQAVDLKPLDLGKLKERLATVEAETKANDPRALKAEIAKLRADLAKATDIRNKHAEPNPAALQTATRTGYDPGFGEGFGEGWGRALLAADEALRVDVARSLDKLLHSPPATAPQAPPRPVAAPVRPKNEPIAARASPQSEDSAAPAALESRETPELTGPQRRILDALAWWRAFGIETPTSEQVGFVAGYAPGSGNFNNLKGGLRSVGLIDYPARGRMSLTDAGAVVAEQPGIAVTREAFHARVRAKLGAPQLRLLEPALAVYPNSLSTDDVAAAAGYAAGSGNFNNLRGSLRTIGLIDYPSPGQVRAADWLFP